MATFEWSSSAADDLAELAAQDFDGTVQQVLQQVSNAAPRGQTGRLRDNLRVIPRTTKGRNAEWTIVARAVSDDGYNYPLTIVKGRKAFAAPPGKVLRWIDKNSRKPVFAKRVRAVAGNNFLAKGLRAAGLNNVREL